MCVCMLTRTWLPLDRGLFTLTLLLVNSKTSRPWFDNWYRAVEMILSQYLSLNWGGVNRTAVSM
jgi:hypothetical protein